MINIQKSYLVHIGSIWSILSSSIQFGPIPPIQSIWSTKVLFGPFGHIQSTLALFGPHQSCSVILSTLIHFSPIRAIQSIVVLFGPFCPLWFYSVHFVHLVLFSLHCSYSVYFGLSRSSLSTSVLFRPIWSYLVHAATSVLFDPPCSYSIHPVLFSPFGPIRSIQITSFHFGPLQSIFVHLPNGKRHVWVEITII